MWANSVIYVVFIVITSSILGLEANVRCAQSLRCISREECNAVHDGRLKELKVILRECNIVHRLICCPAAVKRLPLSTGEEDSSTSTTTTEPTVVTPRTSLPLTDLKTHPNFGLLPDLETCGLRRYRNKRTRRDSHNEALLSQFSTNKVSDGKNAGVGEFPWMALLFYDTSRQGGPLRCGGTLINKRYVLTAAHCLNDEEGRDVTPKFVRLGEYNTAEKCSEESSNLCPQNVKVEEVIRHEKYNTTTNRNDIALLRLDRDVLPTDNKNITPICLPVEPLSDSYMTGRFFVAGWGLTDWSDPSSLSKILQVANFKNSGQCSTCVNNVNLWCPLDPKLTLCIQVSNHRDTCKGDSGGPLMVKSNSNNKQFIQAGVTSFKTDKQCGLQNVPSIYTRVDGYSNWILDHIKQ